MTFIPAGEARLDLYTDALILDIGRDTFVVPLARLADLTAHRRREVVVSRRYWGDAPGTFEDVEQGLRLRRSQTTSRSPESMLWPPHTRAGSRSRRISTRRNMRIPARMSRTKSGSTATWHPANSSGTQGGAPSRAGGTTRGGAGVKLLWFTAGFLLGVVVTALGLLWMMTMAVVA